MRFVFKWLIRLIVIIISVALTICVLVGFVSPETSCIPSILGLGFIPLVIINMLAFSYLLFGWSKWVWLPIIALMLNYGNIQNTIGNLTSKEPDLSTKSIKILTLNSHLFGYFQNAETNDVSTSILSDLRSENADVICLQEFLSLNNHTANRVKARLGYEFSYFAKLHDGRKVGEYGMLILSKFPIIDEGFIEFSKYTGNIGAWVDLSIDGVKYKIIGVHMESIGLGIQDFENLKQPKLDESKGTIRKLCEASGKRFRQVKKLQKMIEKSAFPVMLMGDFNAVPVSYTYSTIARTMNDAYTETQTGFESTFNGDIPGLRIDYIFCSSKLTPRSYKSASVKSDHKMLVAQIGLK